MFARARKGGADGKIGAHRRLGRCTLEEVIDAAGGDLRACKLHLWHVPRYSVCERMTLGNVWLGGGVEFRCNWGGEAAMGLGSCARHLCPSERLLA